MLPIAVVRCSRPPLVRWHRWGWRRICDGATQGLRSICDGAANNVLDVEGMMASWMLTWFTVACFMVAQKSNRAAVDDKVWKTRGGDGGGMSKKSHIMWENPKPETLGPEYWPEYYGLISLSLVDLAKSEAPNDKFKTQLSKIKESPGRGIVITSFAPNGLGFTFNNRFFSHKLGIDEDLVCGSTHCALEAYWHEKL
ncbi:hypothetical protein R6Q59_030121 [Mikania micrantha]